MEAEQVNREIAEKVMGWHKWNNDPLNIVWFTGKELAGFTSEIEADDYFDPMHRIEHAWMVVEKILRLKGNDLHCIHIEHLGDKWQVSCCYELGEWKDWVEADTAQEAICLAALKAKEE